MKPKAKTETTRKKKALTVPYVTGASASYFEPLNEADLASILAATKLELQPDAQPAVVLRILYDAALGYAAGQKEASLGECAEWTTAVEKRCQDVLAAFENLRPNDDSTERATALLRRWPMAVIDVGLGGPLAEGRLLQILRGVDELRRHASAIRRHIAPLMDGKRRAPVTHLRLFAGLQAAYREAFGQQIAVSRSADNEASGPGVRFCQAALACIGAKHDHGDIAALSKPERIADLIAQVRSHSSNTGMGKPLQKK